MKLTRENGIKIILGLLVIGQFLQTYSDYKTSDKIYRFQQLELEYHQVEQEIFENIRLKGEELEARLKELEQEKMENELKIAWKNARSLNDEDQEYGLKYIGTIMKGERKYIFYKDDNNQYWYKSE